jgi:GPH family glycoside/pentoside/hexuronide:cation symporter
MNQEEIIQRSKSTTSKYTIFGMPKLGASIIMGLADFAFATLYIVGYQVSPILVGIALGLGKLSIAFSQFFFGWISDAKYTRWGRRKPYLIILSPILGISFLLILLPSLILDLNDINALFFWLLIWNIIFQASYGVTTPYQSWMAEQFRVDDRPTASQYLNLFGFIGTAIMALFSMIVLTGFTTKIKENPNIIPPEFLYSVIIFAILPIILFYLVCFLMPIEPHFKMESKLTDNLKVILKNKNFILVTCMQGIASIAWIMVGAITLMYVVEVLHFSGTENIIGAACLVLGILIFLYVWKKIIYKYGKLKSVLYIFLAGIFFLPLTLLGMVAMDSYFIFGIFFILGLSACLGGWFLFKSFIFADIAEDDEKTTGELKAGIYQGFPSILLNLFQALGMVIMGIILSLPSIGNLPYSVGLVLWGPICSLILIVAYLYSKKFIQLDFEWEKNQ